MSTVAPTKEFKNVIKADVTLNDAGDVYSTAITPAITNGRTLVRVYWNDDDDALVESKTLTIGLGNAAGASKVDGVIIKVLTGGSGNTAVVKGDLLAEWIIPPTYENTGVNYTIWLRSDNTGSGLTGKDVQVQISMIM